MSFILVQSPATGLQCFQFAVDCHCFCHAPGYKHDAWLFAPCCQCDENKQIIVELYPLHLIEREDVRKRLEMHNYRIVNEYPALFDLIKLP